MCIFTGTVHHVSGTHIFARGMPSDRQALVYSMSFQASADVAMVLPLPTPVGTPDDALAFASLASYSGFFTDLRRGFVHARSGARGALAPGPRLRVHEVGAFEASFVPHPRDFERLDPRFRLPDAVLRERPVYADWGFAVFTLRAESARQKIHPMAFEFPRRDTGRLFVPTLHVHDGALAAEAEFDHVLYAQFDERAPDGWTSTNVPAKSHVHLGRARGLVDGERPIATCSLRGRRLNRDQWILPP